ncbi:MAG: phage replication protein, partial [Leptolyngbyaceae cyanobacterium SM1_4_3]|nr:phage replication protein [Leptolyngbyaceae cyanobacterium SM1_4_3]
MLDTVKLGIPLTQSQFKRVYASAFSNPHPQWALIFPDTGEMQFRRIVGLASTDQNSFHRDIRWDIPQNYHEDDTYLTVELSLPKLYYGHNIRLLYNFVSALELLKELFEKHFGLTGRKRLASIYEWQLWRVDCCYAWQCPSEKIARQILDSLKRLHFPRKKPVIYPTTILFKGTTYSLKFYLKLPEFREHDLKALLKAKASLEWINYCEELASGVLRVEATLRRKYLKQRNIKTVADLLEPSISYEFDLSSHPEGFDFDSAVFAIHCYHMDISEDSDWSVIAADAEDGQAFNAPEGYELEYFTRNGKVDYRHTGEGFILRKTDQPTA